MQQWKWSLEIIIMLIVCYCLLENKALIQFLVFYQTCNGVSELSTWWFLFYFFTPWSSVCICDSAGIFQPFTGCVANLSLRVCNSVTGDRNLGPDTKIFPLHLSLRLYFRQMCPQELGIGRLEAESLLLAMWIHTCGVFVPEHLTCKWVIFFLWL